MKYFDSQMSTSEKIQDSRKRIGNRLGNLRRTNSEKQKEMAELLKVSRSQISKIEQGNADLKASAIPILAEKYDVYAESFFNKDGQIPQEMILRITKAAKLENEENIVRYTDKLMNKVLDSDKAETFAKLFFVILRDCYLYNNPEEHLKGDMLEGQGEYAFKKFIRETEG